MFTLFGRPYLDPLTQSYYNVVTLNMMPSGPLRKFVKPTKFYPLSPFKAINNLNGNNFSNTCGLVIAPEIIQPGNNMNKVGCLTVDHVPALFSYLVQNGYTIDTSLTKMTIMTGLKFNTENADSLIAFVKYNGV